MPVAEIEYPLAGALLGTTFNAGGVYDLTRFFRVPVPPRPGPAPAPAAGTAPVWTAIRCKFFPPYPAPLPSPVPTSLDFPIPTMPDPMTGDPVPIPQGQWDVVFNSAPVATNWEVCSYLVDSAGNEQVSEIVIDITVSASGGADGTVEEVP